MKRFRNIQEEQQGFSLLELVFALALVFILNATGIVTYNSFVQDARKNSIEAIAHGVLQTAREYKMDFDDTKGPEAAETEFMRDRADNSISVKVVDESDCLTVTATHTKGEESTSSYGDCAA